MQNTRREAAAQRALNDIRWLIHGDGPLDGDDDSETYLDGPTICHLLDRNFERLDRDGDGITREELLLGLMNPQAFTPDEYEMLRLLVKYFETIINLVDDEDGEETKITRNDMIVLEQFLVHSQMTLKELHEWCTMTSGAAEDVGPPPLSEGCPPPSDG